jgi:hypothetical protein
MSLSFSSPKPSERSRGRKQAIVECYKYLLLVLDERVRKAKTMLMVPPPGRSYDYVLGYNEGFLQANVELQAKFQNHLVDLEARDVLSPKEIK